MILYIVQKNDCLLKIAEKFKVSPDKIAQQNGFTNIDYLKEGMMIDIPSVDKKL